MANKKEKPFNNPLIRRRRMRGGAGRPKDEKPLTMAEVADAIGYSIGHYSEVEVGATRAGDNMVEALSRFYDVDMETIRDEADAVFDHRQNR